MQSYVFPKNHLSWSLLGDVILGAIVVGPLAAPFLAQSELFPLTVIAKIIYFMGSHVCPQPDMGLMLAPPHVMSVCTRCYGTVLGLLLTRVLLTITQGRGRYWLSRYGALGFLLASILMLAYPTEYFLEVWGGWSYHHPVAASYGFVAGLGLGLWAMPLLHPNSLPQE
jgi:uncharacterized membrane protein